MRKTVIMFLLPLCALQLAACAGSNTGLALGYGGYGHHGPGIAVFMDNLWATPHGGGISVPLGTESGSYSHAPVPVTPVPGVSASLPPPRLGPQPDPRAATAPAQAAPAQPSPAPIYPTPASGPTSGPASGQDGPPASSARLGETPAALIPPDLSYR